MRGSGQEGGAPSAKLYHIQVAPGEVGQYVLIPGDPGRVDTIAACLDDPWLVSYHREYKVMNGYLDGVLVSVISSGIGGPSTAIAVEEMVKCGAHTFVRVGTCGGMQDQVKPGDIVVAQAAIRAEGTSREYMPIEYPAVADFSLTSALIQGAGKQGRTCHIGVVHCKDSFFGQHDPDRMPVGPWLQDRWQAWQRAGCIASEMESAALFVIANVLGVRAATVLMCAGNQGLAKRPGYLPCSDTTPAIKAAIEGLRLMIKDDK